MKTMKFLGFLSAICLSFSVAAQSDAVIMKVNGKPVYKSEFEAIFRKNQKETVITKESLDEYMVLFTNFKLKVTEAEELGLDTNRKFKDELYGYRKQLARPYLVDNEMTDQLVKEAYDRMQTELRASHILIKCEWDADPKDSLAAYNKAMKLRQRIVKGEDFGKVASGKGGSEDPSAVRNKGDLGWFTAFMMVYNFENACYKMNVGDVSQPVRTKFGYHVIKLTGRRPAQGTIKVAHILIGSKAEDTPEMKENARKKADEIKGRLDKGEDFATLAKQFSEDPSSNRKGGELNPFSTGKMVEEFEDAAFALKNDGDISPVIQTSYGYHIIKRLELKPLESFDAMKANLKQKVQRDSRSHLPKKSFVAKLKAKYNFKDDPKALKAFYTVVDTNIFNATWDGKKAASLKGAMFSFADKNYSQTDFTNYLVKNQRQIPKEDMVLFLNNIYDKWVSEELINYEDARLEQLYPEFRMLMKEYRDGILLFELTDQKVWSKAVKDSAGLHQFYEANKSNYMWPKRYDVDVYYCANSTIAKALRKDLKKGKMTNDQLKEKYNKESQLNLKVDGGKLSAEDNELLKKNTPAKAGLSADIQENGQVVIIRTNAIIEPMPKALNEAKGIITSDYQSYLEKTWLESLRKKYPVEINKEVLYTIK
ncbi:MAG: peptidylprolyl isomerase [Flavobacteriales bacterium]|nr:peptidylprolyl isomerase [Flavobacteriales bacterium]